MFYRLALTFNPTFSCAGIGRMPIIRKGPRQQIGVAPDFRIVCSGVGDT
jgi:hypothetical protein